MDVHELETQEGVLYGVTHDLIELVRQDLKRRLQQWDEEGIIPDPDTLLQVDSKGGYDSRYKSSSFGMDRP